MINFEMITYDEAMICYLAYKDRSEHDLLWFYYTISHKGINKEDLSEYIEYLRKNNYNITIYFDENSKEKIFRLI